MFISALLERNRRFAATDIRTQAPAIPFIPNQLSFVITCIDPRTEPAGFLGIELGDAIVERVVGGRVTPAILQDVAYISYLVETKAPAAPWQVLPSQNPAGVSGAGATPDVVLLSHPADGPGGCAGLPAGTDGEVPAAFVVLGEPAPLHEVSAYPAERAAPYKRLRALEAVARSPGRRRARPCGAGTRTQDALSASRARDRCRTKPPLGISSRESGRTVPGREGNARRYGPSGVEPAADRPRPGRRWRYCPGP